MGSSARRVAGMPCAYRTRRATTQGRPYERGGRAAIPWRGGGRGGRIGGRTPFRSGVQGQAPLPESDEVEGAGEEVVGEAIGQGQLQALEAGEEGGVVFEVVVGDIVADAADAIAGQDAAAGRFQGRVEVLGEAGVDGDAKAAAQVKAFEDTWQWDDAAARAYEETVEAGGRASQALQALRSLLGTSNMVAYLAMMTPRLAELRRVLKLTGSIYLHCDPTASHYLKIVMDSIYGPQCFVNEIIWKRATTHSDAKRWSPVTDTILFYSKSDTFTWHPQHTAHDPTYVREKYRFDDHDGRGPYMLDNMTSPNPRPNMMYEWKGFPSPPKGWRYSTETMARLDAEGRIWYPDSTAKRPRLKRYLHEMPGTLLGNVWTDIDPINAMAAERLGYPTQKPLALLERFIQASSNAGDIVLDPFCGCGTAIVAAQKLGRRWIGIDITSLATALIKARLRDTFGESATFQVIGEPVSLPDARTLADQDPYQFQWWALGLVGGTARRAEERQRQGHRRLVVLPRRGRGGRDQAGRPVRQVRSHQRRPPPRSARRHGSGKGRDRRPHHHARANPAHARLGSRCRLLPLPRLEPELSQAPNPDRRRPAARQRHRHATPSPGQRHLQKSSEGQRRGCPHPAPADGLASSSAGRARTQARPCKGRSRLRLCKSHVAFLCSLTDMLDAFL